MTNSRRKGKRGELEAAALLRDMGIEARRGQQFAGTPESPDIVADLFGWHLEVKRGKPRHQAAWAQAVRDCGEHRPLVLWREDRGEWMITARAADVLPRLKEGGER